VYCDRANAPNELTWRVEEKDMMKHSLAQTRSQSDLLLPGQRFAGRGLRKRVESLIGASEWSDGYRW